MFLNVSEFQLQISSGSQHLIPLLMCYVWTQTPRDQTQVLGTYYVTYAFKEFLMVYWAQPSSLPPYILFKTLCFGDTTELT